LHAPKISDFADVVRDPEKRCYFLGALATPSKIWRSFDDHSRFTKSLPWMKKIHDFSQTRVKDFD
jgi:hypothetical protein